MLIVQVKKHNLHLIIAGGKCKGTCTRELGKEKSILDHFSIIKADKECNDRLEIVKDRIRATNIINCIEKHSNVIYSDYHLCKQKKANWVIK